MKNQQIHQLFINFINYVWYLLHVSALYSLLQGAFLLSISQKALGTLPEDGSVMSKYVGATIHN
jgi:hypothetical protein